MPIISFLSLFCQTNNPMFLSIFKRWSFMNVNQDQDEQQQQQLDNHSNEAKYLYGDRKWSEGELEELKKKIEKDYRGYCHVSIMPFQTIIP